MKGAWPRTPAPERAALLQRTADLMQERAAEFARAESLDTGKRMVEAEYDITDVIRCFRYFAGMAGSMAGRVVDTGDRWRGQSH